MKSLDRKIKESNKILFVDGYNIINSWSQLKFCHNLEEARRKLVDIMEEYQVYSGDLIVLVFDSYRIKRDRQVLYKSNLAIVYTKENETADHFIEEMVSSYEKMRHKKIKVATSDRVEQELILAMGATRISAKELEILVDIGSKSMETLIEEDKLKNNLHLSGIGEENSEMLSTLREIIKDRK